MADELMEELRREQRAELRRRKKDLAERYLRDGDEEALDELILLSDPDEIPRRRSVMAGSSLPQPGDFIQRRQFAQTKPFYSQEERYRNYAEQVAGVPTSAVPDHDQEPLEGNWPGKSSLERGHQISPGVRVETTGAEDIVQASESTSRGGGPGQTIEEAREGHRADVEKHDKVSLNRLTTPEDFMDRLGVGREEATIISNIANEAYERKMAGRGSLRGIEEEFPEGE